jgi:hypothetical protein
MSTNLALSRATFAPTGLSVAHETSGAPQIIVGAELAREGGVSGDKNVD